MLYCFDKKENLLREINSDSLVSPIQTESLNSLMILEFGVFVKDIDLMDDVEFVAHKDMENPNRIQMYKVLSSTSEDSYVSYQAIHILFDELKSYGYIRDRRLKQVKASAALEAVLQGSRWQVGACDDSDLLTTNFYDLSRLEALSKVINIWGLDLDFYLTFDGSKISGRYVRLVSNRGEDTGERFVYGSNALEVVAEIDKSEIYTRIIPRGRGEEKFDEDGKSKDTFGRRIKINEVVWSKSKGDPIDKPLGQEYLELEEATKKFGYSDGTPRTKVQVFEDIEKPEDLIKAGYDFLVNISRPLVQFKSKVFKESRTGVGDIVRIIRKDLAIYYMTRIFKVRRNLITKNVEVEFGDKIVKSQLEREKSLKIDIEALKSKQRDMTLSFRDRVTKAMTEAMFNQDGYNYELKKGNAYGLPAGYYSFDRDINDNPTKVIYVGAGTMAIANSKKSNGDWDFKTFGTGDGFVADLIIAGMIRGGKVRWNLDDGTFLIGESVDKYTMYWDGSTLYLRNVDIDLSNNHDIKNINKQIKETEDNFNESVSKVNNAVSNLDGRVTNLGSSVDARLTNVTGSIETIKQDFKVGQGRLESTINTKIDKLNADIELDYKNLDQRISTNMTGLASLSSQIKQTESSITQSVASQITAVSKKVDSETGNLKSYVDSNYSTKNQVDSLVNNESSKLKTYVADNYSTKTQTSSMISSEVSSKISGVNSQISNLSSRLSQTASELSTKVTSGQAESIFKQEASKFTFKASQIDFSGNVNLAGTFTTKNKGGYKNVNMEDSRITFYRNSNGQYSDTEKVGYISGDTVTVRRFTGGDPYNDSNYENYDYSGPFISNALGKGIIFGQDITTGGWSYKEKSDFERDLYCRFKLGTYYNREPYPIRFYQNTVFEKEVSVEGVFKARQLNFSLFKIGLEQSSSFYIYDVNLNKYLHFDFTDNSINWKYGKPSNMI